MHYVYTGFFWVMWTREGMCLPMERGGVRLHIQPKYGLTVTEIEWIDNHNIILTRDRDGTRHQALVSDVMIFKRAGRGVAIRLRA